MAVVLLGGHDKDGHIWRHVWSKQHLLAATNLVGHDGKCALLIIISGDRRKGDEQFIATLPLLSVALDGKVEVQPVVFSDPG